jgi:hypothetical protein
LGDLTIALEARGELTAETARAFAEVGGWIVASGGSVIVSRSGALLAHEAFRQHAFESTGPAEATLAHGQRPKQPGWHVMRTQTTDWTETASGLGACGAQVLLTHVAGGTVSGQRLLPVVQVTSDAATAERYGQDLDALLGGGAVHQARALLDVLVAVASGDQVPRVFETGDVAFQITRGLLGTSM